MTAASSSTPGRAPSSTASKEIGVRQIEWVLHTHHHRDQSWGTGRLREHGAKVAVPEHETPSLSSRPSSSGNTSASTTTTTTATPFFALAENVPVDADLEDYETFTWRDVELQIVPAKGHTHGSSMLIGSIDGQSVAFTGDLLGAGGVLYQYHALEYGYGDQQGALFTPAVAARRCGGTRPIWRSRPTGT